MRIRELIGLLTGGWKREWSIFALSLLAAVGIWLLSNLGQTYSGTISVPVVAECNLDGFAGRSSNSVLVSARCRAEGFRLLRERSGRERKAVTVRFEKTDMRRTGTETFAVIGGAKNSYISQIFGANVQVEAFITDTLSFVFPKENHKKVPVEVPMTVVCRSQYMQSGPFRVTPDSVTVYGDDVHLEAIERVLAERLSLTDLHESSHGMLRLSKPKGVRLSADEVAYELPVSRYVELRSTLSVEVWNAPAGHTLQVYPPTAEVVMRCVFPLSKDPLASFKIYIDYKDFRESMSGQCVPRYLRLPAGVLDCRINPEVFDCIELN
jgi:hypothetical protein